MASVGYKNTFLEGIANKNLFPMMFKWVDIGDHKSILRFKSLRSDKINYAPTITIYGKEDEFYYNGDWTTDKITLSCCFIGNVHLEYKDKCIVKVLAPHTHFDVNKHLEYCKIEDNSDVLEIDYSEEAVERGEYLRREKIRKEVEKRRRKEIERIKSKIRNNKKQRELEKIAFQELIDEGEIFPESNKRPHIPKDVVDAVWNRDGGKCVYCGSSENLHLDHIIPFSKGGDSSVENLQLLCQKCNLHKSNKIG